MSESYFIVPRASHDALVETAFVHRGYSRAEAQSMARLCADAARHGIHTHNAIKALHLEDLFGRSVGGCVPNAQVEELPSRFPAARVWNANRKLGSAVAFNAMDTCIRLADQFGMGMVSVDNAWHYLWGGAYALHAARQGYIGYTNCTAMLAEVVPFGGTSPTLGTNPHTWAFPTTEIIGFPILVDWATSAVAMGRVQQLKREGKKLAPNCALDAQGNPTDEPAEAAALLPFGAHKGYGLGLIDEIFAGLIGGSLPTIRGRFVDDDAKHTPCFFFMAIHPEALSGQGFEGGCDQASNLRAVLDDILAHGNTRAILPGQIEADQARISDHLQGYLFTKAEIEALSEVAQECGDTSWRPGSFNQYQGEQNLDNRRTHHPLNPPYDPRTAQSA